MRFPGSSSVVVVSMQLTGVSEDEFGNADVQAAFKKSAAATVGVTADEVCCLCGAGAQSPAPTPPHSDGCVV